MIHVLDTRNPRDGWRTCFTLPFTYSNGESAVVDDQWLYIFCGNRHNDGLPLDPWGYAVNVVDDNQKEVRKITQPGDSANFPIFSTCLSPGTLVACMSEDGNLYQLDCKDSTWSVYLKDLPYDTTTRWLLRSTTTVVDDGILYIYDCEGLGLTCYDIRNKRELYVVELPRSFWFGHQQFVWLIVLSENRFCIIWDLGGGDNELCICYTRFSVSYDHLPKPTVVVEEKRSFNVVGCSLLNVVAVDPHSDEANSSSSNSNAVHETA